MKTMNIAAMDLNLLRVFDAITREGTVVGAANRLGMSQPAASHALTRLRQTLDDDLFIRSSQGMQPTVHAQKLANHVRRALMELELGLRTIAFDPASSARSFSIAVDNYCAMVLTGPVLAAVRRAAPLLQVKFLPSGTLDTEQMMDSDELDLSLGGATQQRDRFSMEKLISDEFVVLRRALPRTEAGHLTVEDFASRPHLHLSSTQDDTGFVDLELSKQGLSRRIEHSVPLLACEAVLTEYDALVVMRRAMAVVFAARSAVTIFALPFASRPVETSMRWHRRHSGEPGHEWFRNTVKAAAAATFQLQEGKATARESA